MPITLTGFLTCRTLAEADRASETLADHLRSTLAEDGCMSFEIHRSMADPVCFAVRAVFRDRESLAAHLARAGTSDWGKATRHAARDFRLSETWSGN
ncbi:MAG: putative quinol monooxygenase [Pseudomonadota bacterium]|jgi:quinol monooxygenase YgiN